MELEKETADLKDKVERQEAFLKKKLLQEKATRASLRTPTRSSRKTPSSAPRRISGIPTIQDSSSMDTSMRSSSISSPPSMKRASRSRLPTPGGRNDGSYTSDIDSI